MSTDPLKPSLTNPDLTNPENDSPRSDLAERLLQLAPRPGVHELKWPGAVVVHVDQPQPRTPIVYEPLVCIVAQGAKEAWLGETRFVYDRAQYLALSVPLPLECRVIEATPEEPYLALILPVDVAMLGGLLDELGTRATRQDVEDATRRGIYATPLDRPLIDVVTRFLQSTLDEQECRILAPGAYREFLFRLLQGEQASPLRAAGLHDSRAARIGKLLRMIHAHYDEPMDVAFMADQAAMSQTTLHESFKAVTDMTPLAYLKQVRLLQSRVLLRGGLGAAEAAYRVGYRSASQFSREYKRAFGVAPSHEREASTP